MRVGRGGVFEIHLMLMCEPVLFLQPKLVLLELLAPQRGILEWTNGGHATWFVVAESVAHLYEVRRARVVYVIIGGLFRVQETETERKG